MGLDGAIAAACRARAPFAYCYGDKPLDGVVLDRLFADIGQTIYALKVPAICRDTVARACADHLVQLAKICIETMRAANPESTDLPIIFALLDTFKLVTRAKDICHEERYRRSHAAPEQADQLVARYLSKQCITCDWADFLSYSPGRHAVLESVQKDLAKLADTLTPYGTLVIDGTDIGGPSGLGEAELKAQMLTLTTSGRGFLIDSSDTDFIAIQLLTGRLLKNDEGRFTKNMILRSRVGGGKQNYSYNEVMHGLMLNEGLTEEQAKAQLAEAEILPDTTRKEMPEGAPTICAHRTQYCDLNALYMSYESEAEHLPESVAYLALLGGSDLVRGRYAAPGDLGYKEVRGRPNHAKAVPGVGAWVLLSYYLEHREMFGDLVQATKAGPCEVSLEFNIRAVWKLLSAVYSAKMHTVLKKRGHLLLGSFPSYATLRTICVENTKKDHENYALMVPTVKAMLCNIMCARHALDVYSLKQVDCLQPHPVSGMPVTPFVLRSDGRVDLVADWDPKIKPDDNDDQKLHNQDELCAGAYMNYVIAGDLPLIPRMPAELKKRGVPVVPREKKARKPRAPRKKKSDEGGEGTGERKKRKPRKKKEEPKDEERGGEDDDPFDVTEIGTNTAQQFVDLMDQMDDEDGQSEEELSEPSARVRRTEFMGMDVHAMDRPSEQQGTRKRKK